MTIDLKNTAIYKAVKWEKRPPFLGAEKLSYIFLFISLFSFISIFFEDLLSFNFYQLFSSGVACFILFIVFLQAKLFFNNCLCLPRLYMSLKEASKSEVNFAEFFDFQSAKIINKVNSRKSADSYTLLYYLVKDKNNIDFVFSRALINKEGVLSDLNKLFSKRKKFKENTYSSCLKKSIKESVNIAIKKDHTRITKGDLFSSLCYHNPYMTEILYRHSLKPEDISDLVSWHERLLKKEDSFSYESLVKRGSLGKQWSAGYTPLLDQYSVDFNKVLKNSGFPKTIGHEKEIKSLERVLSRTQVNSVILVGEPGTGRKSMIRELARRSFLGESLPEIKYMRVVQLDIASVLARCNNFEETEAVLDRIFYEVSFAGNIILVIDDIHNFVGGEKRPGVVNISGLLEPYMRLPNMRVVGITSFLGYRQEVEKNPSLLSLLERVEVKNVSKEDTLLLLERMISSLERRYRKFTSYAAIKSTISLSDRYMQNNPFPEKAINLLEESVVHVDQIGEHIILPEHIAAVLSEKTEVPIGEIDIKEKEVLLNLENLMHERIVNQELAVKEIASALRRSRAGVSSRKGLIGSFLFLGPTGVGKTETAKAVTDIYFHSEKKMIRIDMSEFQSISDISRLIGSTTQEGILTSKVRENPFSMILLDEIEKAHPDILNIFLQILDEGHVTDGLGRKIDFKNSMIIATSNAGYQIIIDTINRKDDWKNLKKKIINRLFREKIFRPEFVNRFDAVVLFEPLTKENLFDISAMQLKNLADSLSERDIEFIITDDLKKLIVKMSYDPLFGAREMQRIIQDRVGNLLSSAILKEEIKKGDSFIIDTKNFTIIKQ